MLKIGKIPDTVLNRSVLRRITGKNEDTVIGASIGIDCSVINIEDCSKIVSSVAVATCKSGVSAQYAVHSAVNNIVTSGADPVAVQALVLLPEASEETLLKGIIDDINASCNKLGIELVGGHTEVVDSVKWPTVSITSIGKLKDDPVLASGAQCGDDIVITKWVGIEGTAILAARHEEQLKKRFSQAFVETAIDFSKMLSVIGEATIAKKSNVHAMHDVSKCGIFGALWEFGEASHKGMEIDMMSIPIRQETVEICEELETNPYEMTSAGSLLIATDNGHDLVRLLQKDGINAAVIGKITEDNDKVVVNGDEKRFLYRPQKDAINE